LNATPLAWMPIGKPEVGRERPPPNGELTMRIATYLRISTDEERQPFSLEAQADRLAAYVSAQPGWRQVLSYDDRMSGKQLNRPGLARALADERGGRYDLLLVFKVDRLARSVSGLAQVLEALDTAGVAFRSASEPFDTSTPAGRMMVQMLGVFAEFERELIVERTKMGLAKKAAKGEWTGGTPPFGYHYDPASRLLAPVPAQAAVVQRIFTLYVDRGLGSAVISGLLNDAGQATGRRCRWTPSRVLEILALEARRASLVAECDSEPALPTDADLAALRRQLEQSDRRRRPRAAQAAAAHGRGAHHRGEPRLHPAVLLCAHGSYGTGPRRRTGIEPA
jgi:DNA invertase Pin-like site-specific DNA recombinase